MTTTSHRYRHATIMAGAEELLETQQFNVSLTGTTKTEVTAGHVGSRRAKNPATPAKFTSKFQVPATGPEFDFVGSLAQGDWVNITVDDPMFGGEYEIQIDECSADDDFSGGEVTYNMSGSGFKIT
jgi:hypothetical protein